MIGKILGISFIIVSFFHFYLLFNMEIKTKIPLNSKKKEEVNFINLTNYQIKEIVKIEQKKEVIKEIKQQPKKVEKKIVKPKKIKKIEKIEKKIVKKVIQNPKEILEPKKIEEKIVNAKIEPIKEKIVENIKKELSRVIVSKQIDKKIEEIKLIYTTALRKKIEEYKNYPRVSRKLGQEGSVEVKFTILDNGLIQDIKILRPSNHTRLNRATIKTLQDINKFKPLPKELKLTKWEFILPVEFKLN